MNATMQINAKTLKNKITDTTGFSWETSELGSGVYRFDWVHPDAPEGHQKDGTYITWSEESEHCLVFSEDNVCFYSCEIATMNEKLKIAVLYSQMAGGLIASFGELDNPPTPEACNAIVEALYLAGDYDPAFTGSKSGVDWWTEDGEFVGEYVSKCDAYIIWNHGMHWSSATPEGYLKSLEKAKADCEKMEFNRLKSELSEN